VGRIPQRLTQATTPDGASRRPALDETSKETDLHSDLELIKIDGLGLPISKRHATAVLEVRIVHDHSFSYASDRMGTLIPTIIE